MENGIEKAVDGANAVLSMNGEIITSAVADFFGEFKLDRIPPNSGSFDLTISNNGEVKKVLKVEVGDTCPNVGVITID